MAPAKQKKCPKCKNSLPVIIFVDMGGNPNPRGKYCINCHQEIIKEGINSALEIERGYIKKLKLVFGTDWEKYTYPHELETTLWRERDFCPYCGIIFDKSPNNCIDHMDPLIKGGEDSFRNAIYCCETCNLKKGTMLFNEWLTTLNLECRSISKQVYFKKLGYFPEEFTEGEPNFRAGHGLRGWLLLNEKEIMEMLENGFKLY